ncbi:S41 family peptidase [Desulfogranum mediterraneum]|uniref:S41 family peptidase n=1 Tax=Desulfogranum mediterraneum TaxID=160661 RepID=UPI0003FAAD2B|nr:S41 family peptidase [Desulfogranum mediterraneum]
MKRHPAPLPLQPAAPGIRRSRPWQQGRQQLCRLILFSFFLLLAAVPTRADDSQLNRETYQQLELFANVLALLQQHYVDEVDTREVITGAINGMLNSLDPHSSYMSAEDFKELQEETQGSFNGIGLEITIRDGILTVVAPIEGTPAARKEIEAGDQILAIDGELTKNMSLLEAMKRLRGPRDTRVTLTIFRRTWREMRDIELQRAAIPLHSVKGMELEPGLFYLRISTFQSATTRDVRQALREAGKAAELKGLIMDLRNNPGGLLDQAVKVTDIFIDQGTIVSTKGKDNSQEMVFSAHPGGAFNHTPMVVLVNGGSASGSEIVAGALQDHKRAIILGTPSFGKGSVQTILPMPGGAGVRLTTARYYTPNGTSIQNTGIQPDIEVPARPQLDRQDEPQLRERDLPHHLEDAAGQEKPQADSSEETDGDTSPALAARLKGDNQLQTALIILKSLEIAAERP